MGAPRSQLCQKPRNQRAPQVGRDWLEGTPTIESNPQLLTARNPSENPEQGWEEVGCQIPPSLGLGRVPQPPTGHPRRDVLEGCGDLGPQRIKPTWDPFPRPRQRKDPRGSPKNPPYNRWGRMLLGSAREDSPRQGCPSSRGCWERPASPGRGGPGSPVLTSAGGERRGAVGGAGPAAGARSPPLLLYMHCPAL